MNIKTSRFGEIEVKEELVFNFIEPILGYEQLSKFALVDHQPESPFKWLQSVEKEDVAFPVTVPSFFGLDYQFVVPEKEAKMLEITNPQGVLTLNIVNIPSGEPKKSTVNLIGPLVINTENQKAMQLVLVDTNFSVRHRLFQDESAPKQSKQKEEANSKA